MNSRIVYYSDICIYILMHVLIQLIVCIYTYACINSIASAHSVT